MAFRIELSLVASTSVVRATKVVKLSSSSLVLSMQGISLWAAGADALLHVHCESSYLRLYSM